MNKKIEERSNKISSAILSISNETEENSAVLEQVTASVENQNKNIKDLVSSVNWVNRLKN
ncbi:hypothetical protein [Wukongibacter sp. M2B1]|uniref:hypothetical protein n=1 Tax=Wukongibacter sp. M2B1 TaxID=3088895 RepID=UPI003D7A3B2A